MIAMLRLLFSAVLLHLSIRLLPAVEGAGAARFLMGEAAKALMLGMGADD